MCDLLNQALVYTAMLNTAIQKSSAQPITAKTNTNVERQHENSFTIQFLSKPMFEMFLFPALYAKKCDHRHLPFYPSHAIIEEFCHSLAQDLCNLPKHIKR